MTSYIYIAKVSAGTFKLVLNKAPVKKSNEESYKEVTAAVVDKTCVAAFKCNYGVSAYTELTKAFDTKYGKLENKPHVYKGDEYEMCESVLTYIKNRKPKRGGKTSPETEEVAETEELPESEVASESAVAESAPVESVPELDLLTS
jgi:hypothetical protein